jgi:hypothetical protein
MRGYPNTANSIAMTAGNYMSFWEYGGIFRFYKKQPSVLTLQAWIDNGSITATTDSRAPIFYDSDNTGYYVNPAGTSEMSRVNGLNFYSSNWFRNVDSGDGLFNQATGQHWYSDDDDYWNIAGGGSANGIRFRDSHAGTIRGYVYATAANDVGILDNAGSWRVKSVGGSHTEITGSARSPIFYDSDDTNHYIDPNSTTTAGFIRGKLLIGTNNTWGKTIQIGGNGREYVNNTNVASVVTTNGNLHLDAASGSETFINYYDGNKVHFGNGSNGTVGEIHSDGSARFPIFYDWNSTAYYVDPAGQSRMGNIERNTHSTGFLVGSYNSVGANSAKTNPIYTIGNNYKPTDTSIAGMYGIGYAHGNLWGSGKTPGWGLYVAAAGGYNCTIGDGSTTIWAQNDIVAYSDKRVKDNIEIIPDAVEKVKQLNGVTFTRTDANEEDKNKRHTGVIAQDVLKVLPEAVVGSEEDLYSVAYGNMVGLLIEAIKEQQTQIDELKQLINKK